MKCQCSVYSTISFIVCFSSCLANNLPKQVLVLNFSNHSFGEKLLTAIY